MINPNGTVNYNELRLKAEADTDTSFLLPWLPFPIVESDPIQPTEMLSHIKQPDGSSLCGQTCVAMAAGVSLERSIEVFGSRGATRTKQVIKALRELGLNPIGDKLTRRKGAEKAPAYGILKILFERFNEVDGKIHEWSHWALMWDGVLHDPGEDQPGVTSPNGRFSSYLLIWPPYMD